MAAPSDIVSRVETHLNQVIREPQTPLDKRLLENLTGEASSVLTQEQRFSLVSLVAQILQSVQQDPEPVTRLAESLVETFSFSDVQKINPPVDLIAGIKAPSPPIQLLALRLIGRASQTPADVSVIAGNIELVKSLVEVWLRTTDIAVAERAGGTLTALLLADTAPTEMSALMQRRLFKDKDIYGILLSLPSLKTVGMDGQPSKKDKTIAQGRLFSFLQDVWQIEDVWQSQIPEIEQRVGLKSGEGLMHFAALHMVDKDDVLLRRTQIDFYASLIRSTDPTLWSRRRKGNDQLLDRSLAAAKVMEFLQKNGIHQDLISLYATPEGHDPIDASFLHSAAASYVVEYLLYYRQDFLSNEEVRRTIFKRLSRSISDTPGSRWARNDGPSDDLNVLVSIPFPALVSDDSILLLPTKPPSSDVFRCLGRLFSGVNPREASKEIVYTMQSEAPSESDAQALSEAEEKEIAEADAWASRCLYLRYAMPQPNFWSNLIAASSAAALKDTAISAINLMTMIIRARWRTDPPSGAGLEVSDSARSAMNHPDAPDTGLAAVLHPRVLDLVVPFLMKGPSEGRVINLLGADTESAEYHVARAKLEMTRALKEGIEGLVAGLQVAGGGTSTSTGGTVTESENETETETNEKALLTELAAGLGVLLRQGIGRRGMGEPGAEIGTMEL